MKSIFPYGLILFLLACSSTELAPSLRRPALSNNINVERMLLETAISEMMNGTDIIVADDAFVNSSDLIIERRLQSSGRDFDMPDHFRLWKRGESCLLEHVESGEMKNIEELNCVKNTN
ncbi:MAG: hypothetical protein P8J61_04165 [Gammaproteobacteria bacterium]|jgi:hypothetical protein|nr:hypothetical protein [Gammaproteobacteria bacterium]